MEEFTFTQQQKQLKLDRRALELDRQAFQLEMETKSNQLESKKKSFELEMEQQRVNLKQEKLRFEQQVLSLNLREQSLNARFNRIEQTLLDISLTPLQHEEQVQQKRQEQQQQALSSSSSPDDQSIITAVADFEMMIDTYDQHLTTLAKTLRKTARKFAKREVELNEKIKKYNPPPQVVIEQKPSKVVVRQTTSCTKCATIKTLNQLQKDLDQREERLNQTEQILIGDQARHRLLLKQTDFAMSGSRHGRLLECLRMLKQNTRNCVIPSLDTSYPEWKWASICNEFCWKMYFQKHSISRYQLTVTLVRDDERSYRTKYLVQFGTFFGPHGSIRNLIKDTLQQHYTKPITKISFSTPSLNNGEWFTIENTDFDLFLFVLSPQEVMKAVDTDTTSDIDATEHETLFKVEE